MATDTGTDDDDALEDDDDDGDTVEVDREELRTLIREEVKGVIESFRTGGDAGGDADKGGGDDAPVTVKGVEAAVESAMRNAMVTLQSKTPSKPKPKAKPKPKEDAPTDPPKTRWDKLREAAWS